MKELLDALYAWYEENEPESIQRVFASPASVEDIEAAEKALGIPFPDDLRAIYLRHEYVVNVWGSINVSSPKEIPGDHSQLLKLAEQIAEDYAIDAKATPDIEPMLRARGPVAPLIHTGTRIPFAADNDRDILIDMSPPKGGKVGQIIRLDIECREIEVIADGLQDFFAQGLVQLITDRQRKTSLVGKLLDLIFRRKQ